MNTELESENLSSGTRGTVVFRQEATVPSGYLPFDSIPTQASLTNDIVEDIISNSAILFSFRTVMTRRGFALGTQPKKFWSNDVVVLQAADFNFVPVRNDAAVYQNENGQTVEIPAGFTRTAVVYARISRKTATINEADQTTSLPDNWTTTTQDSSFVLARQTESEIQIIYLNLVRENLFRMRDGVTYTYSRQ